MKKMILALFAAASVTAADAQEGSWLLYGHAGFHMTSDTGTATSFNINPGVGYQFSKHSTIGIQGGFMSRTTPGITADITTSQFSAGVFYRYTHYFNNIFSIFGQADGSYMGQDFGGATISGFGVQITPAVAINVHNGLALNFGVGGIGYKITDPGGLDLSELNVTFGNHFNFGISKNFGCKSKKGGHGHDGSSESRHKNMKDTKDDDDE